VISLAGGDSPQNVAAEDVELVVPGLFRFYENETLRRACSAALGLVVPVVELGLALEHGLIALRLRPEPDLAAVRVVDDGER